MNIKNVQRIVIVGGGTAGWIAATALSHQLGKVLDISIVESPTVSTIGVGEATIPTLKRFHQLLHIDEREFMRETQATFKLGIQFENWLNGNDKYLHGFGRIGQPTWLAEFHHFWLQGKSIGIDHSINEYQLEYFAALEGKFSGGQHTELNYAYHLDAGCYINFLRKRSLKQGVSHISATVKEVIQDHTTGDILSLKLDNEQSIQGDLFIDCTGFEGLLIEKTLRAGFDDWSHWFPCNRAIAVQSENNEPTIPLTRAIAHTAGWQWKIPLQHRCGNGIVFSDSEISVDEASSTLLAGLSGKPINDIKVIHYKAGKRRQFWKKNCVALGLSSGFLEPLESTSIHLFIAGITRLMQLIPSGEISPKVIEEYNQRTEQEIIRIRDFLILHYNQTQRSDSNFWRYCKQMDIPDSLSHRIDMFKETGHAFQHKDELFRVESWLQVLLGQGVTPMQCHPLAKSLSNKELRNLLSGIRNTMKNKASTMPSHDSFLKSYLQ